MVRAKISAFMERQDTVYRRFPLSNSTLPARYARAITTYLHGDLNNALSAILGLAELAAEDPDARSSRPDLLAIAHEASRAGELTRRLLEHFGSVQAVKQADAAALSAVVTRAQAEAIMGHFRK